MKQKSRTLKKQKLTLGSFLFKVAGFFLLLVGIINVVFNIISIMQPQYHYGYGFASTSYLFMYFHEAIQNTSLRISLVIIISFFFSGVFTFIGTEINRNHLNYLVIGFIAYAIDFLFLLMPFPYALTATELNFSFIVHVSVLGVLFLIIIIQFILRHLDNVKLREKL